MSGEDVEEQKDGRVVTRTVYGSGSVVDVWQTPFGGEGGA